MRYTSLFRITDGTPANTIDMIEPPFNLVDWNPSNPEPKDNGVWQDNPMVTGRRPLLAVMGNIIDTFTFDTFAYGLDAQDRNSELVRKLKKLLQQARDYWTNSYATSPVWIEAKGTKETNIRYALIYDWRLPNDPNPYQSPAVDKLRSFFSFTDLVIEHDLWTGYPPTSPYNPGTFINHQIVPIWYTRISVDDPVVTSASLGNYITCGSDATIDDMALANFTAEGWIYIDTNEPASSVAGSVIFSKKTDTISEGWEFGVDFTGHLYGRIYSAGRDAYTVTNAVLATNVHQHVLMTYTAATQTVTLWVDGSNPACATTTGIGAIIADATKNLLLGNRSDYKAWFHGFLGWCRLSTTILYAAPFTPERRSRRPVYRATDRGVWNVYSLNRTVTVFDYNGIAGRNGTANKKLVQYPVTTINLSKAKSTAIQSEFISNGRQNSQPTHVFRYDVSAATYSANLMETFVAQNLFPAVPDVLDYTFVIFEQNKPLGLQGLLFEITFAAAVGNATEFYYWNGAWVILAGVDGQPTADFFGTTGLHHISWDVPVDMIPTTINGITGYAYKIMKNSAVGNVVVGTWNDGLGTAHFGIGVPNGDYLRVEGVDLKGDLPSKALYHLIHKMAYVYSFTPTKHFIGVRSASRSQYFTPYIMGDKVPWMDELYTITPMGASTLAYASHYIAPSQRYPILTIAAGEYVQLEYSIEREVSLSFQGTFRMILRGYATSGSLGNVQVNYAITHPNARSSQPHPLGIAAYSYIDFGLITLGSPAMLGVSECDIKFNVRFTNYNAAPRTVHVWDIVLIPADEWMGEITEGILHTYPYYTGRVGQGLNPKFPRAGIGYKQTRTLTDVWTKPFEEYSVSSTGLPVLEHSVDQNVYIFSICRAPVAYGGGTSIVSYYTPNHILLNAKALINPVYFSSRGSS